MTSSELLERAIAMRFSIGPRAAADWLAGHGFPWELALIALIGGRASEKYGVKIKPEWDTLWRRSRSK